MTNEEIEAYQQQLIEAKKIKDKGQRNIALIALCEAVGASGCGGDKPWPERDAQNIASIQEALKTAAMINMAKKPVFPTLSRLPSSIKESQFSPFEAEDYPEDGDVLVLMEKMFHKPEIDFYYFKEKGKQQSTAIDSAIERGDLIKIESQFYWYRHPNTGHNRDFIRIELPEHEWHHQAIKKSPMFIRTQLKLSERKRIEIESWLKVRMEESYRLHAQRQKYEHDVFLSYASAESKIAHEIHSKLTEKGLKAFLAEKSIEPGSDFVEEVRLALLNSKEIWLIVSSSSIESEWVISEWGAGWALQKKIVPILYRCEPKKLPERLKRLQCIDLHRYEELIDQTIKRYEGKD